MWDIDFNRLRDVFVYDPQAPMIFSSGIFLWLFAAFILVYLLFATPSDCTFVVCYRIFPIIFIIKVVELTFSCWHLSRLPISLLPVSWHSPLCVGSVSCGY